MNLTGELLSDPPAVRANRQWAAVVVAVGTKIPALQNLTRKNNLVRPCFRRL